MNRLLVAIVTLPLSSSPAWAQVVQLPTFDIFSYSGTVMVPDGGSVSLGGVSRSASSSRTTGFGPHRNRAVGRETSRSVASAHVRIIDLAEMDRHLLGATPKEFLRREKANENLTRSATLKLEQTAKIDPVESAKQWVRDARAAKKKGYLKAADYMYRTAIRMLPPDLAKYAQNEYDTFVKTNLATDVAVSVAALAKP